RGDDEDAPARNPKRQSRHDAGFAAADRNLQNHVAGLLREVLSYRPVTFPLRVAQQLVALDRRSRRPKNTVFGRGRTHLILEPERLKLGTLVVAVAVRGMTHGLQLACG